LLVLTEYEVAARDRVADDTGDITNAYKGSHAVPQDAVHSQAIA
jgi:hypothetical protein